MPIILLIGTMIFVIWMLTKTPQPQVGLPDGKGPLLPPDPPLPPPVFRGTLEVKRTTGNRAAFSFPLNSEKVTIGRNDSNQIRLDQPEVSRKHAELRYEEGEGWTVYDCDSTHGTFSFGARRAKFPLYPGDRFEIGDYTFIFSSGKEAASTPEMDTLGNYDLLRAINGGMGRVEIIRREEDGKTYALKTPVPSLSGLPERMVTDLFEKEIAILKILNRHPNIVSLVLDGTLPDGLRFMLLEYVAGGTVKRYMNGQPLPEEEVRYIGSQVAKALLFAHENGIVHRDLKTENIMIREDRTICLTDFGVAKSSHTSAATLTSYQIGNVAYMSPEIVRGERATPLSDYYSLGCVLYEMATGHFTFEFSSTGEANHTQIAEAHCKLVPHSPRVFNPQISEPLSSLIMCLLNKTPQNRIPPGGLVSELNSGATSPPRLPVAS